MSVSTVRISLSAGHGIVATLVLLQEMHAPRRNDNRRQLHTVWRCIFIVDLDLIDSIPSTNEMVLGNKEVRTEYFSYYSDIVLFE